MNKILAAFMIFMIPFIICLYLFVNGKEANSSDLNVYEKFSAKKPVNYLIIGDSIGRGAGAKNKSMTWFSQWETLLKNGYGTEVYRYSVVQSGATAFEGLNLFKKANIPVNIDLVFLIFGENDRKYMDASQFSFFYEALIRETKKIYPQAEIITVTESCLKNELFAHTIETLSNHYETNHVDMRIPFHNSGKTELELTADLVHPNALGYEIYAKSFVKAIEQGIQTNKKIAYLNNPLTEHKADVQVKNITNFNIQKGQFIQLNGYHSTREKGAVISYQFTGPFLGVNVLKSPEGGEMDVFIDGHFVRRISTWWPLQKERALYVTSDLSQGNHEVVFRMTGTKSANNTYDQPIIQISSIIVKKE